MKKLLFIILLFTSIVCKAQFTPVILSDTISVSTSELADLYNTPKLIISAPGSGKIIVVLRTTAIGYYVGPQFTGGSAYLQYGNTAIPPGTAFLASGGFNIVNISTDKVLMPNVHNGSGDTGDFTVLENQPIYLRNSNAITGSGNSTAKIIVLYQIIDL